MGKSTVNDRCSRSFCFLPLCTANHVLYVLLHFCAKNPVAYTLRFTPTILVLPFHLSSCLQTDAMTCAWVLNIPMNRMETDNSRVMKGTMLEENWYGRGYPPWPQYSIQLYSLQTIISLLLCHMACATTVHVKVLTLFIMGNNKNTA
jgi:hypothetical protein